MYKYVYEGPVMEFNRCIASNWRGETMAVSRSKARSNLTYQFKKQFNRVASTKITLPGEIILVNSKHERTG